MMIEQDAECEEHNFIYSQQYMCPVCEGVLLEKIRITSALEECYTGDEDDWAIDWALEIVNRGTGK